MVKKRHVLFKENVIKSNSYLQKNILKDENNKKFKCLACSEFFGKEAIYYFENLKAHLQSDNHGKTLTKTEKLESTLSSVLTHLKSFKLDQNDEISEENNEEETVNQNQTPTLALVHHKISNQINYRFEITNFIIKNNLPFSFAEKFGPFLQKLLQEFTLDSLLQFSVRTKHITKIASQCIASTIQEKYLQTLKHTFFSLAIDESSMKGTTEYLNISARFFDQEDSERTVTKLLGVIQLDGSKTGKTIYDLVEGFLFTGLEGKERKKKLMGIATDHGSNMISSVGAGVTNRFQSDLPYLVITHDFCHALSLILEDCIQSFPTEFQDIVKNISSMFSRSPSRAANFKRLIKEEFQILRPTNQDEEEKNNEEINIKVLSILRYLKHRWSSFYDALYRIIELAEPLKKFIESEYKLLAPEREYLNPKNILMLKLFLCLTGMINDYIKDFQRENMNMTEIVETVKECQLMFAEYILDLSADNLRNESQSQKKSKVYDQIYEVLTPVLKEREESYLFDTYERKEDSFRENFLNKHTEFVQILSDMEDIQDEFFANARSFLTTAFNQIKTRLPDPDSIIFLTESLKMNDKSCIDKVRTIANRFKNVISEAELGIFNKELIKLQYRFEEIHDKITKHSFFEAWESEKNKFPLVYRLARAIQTLPYSTTFIERSFSSALNIKTLKRNRITTNNLEACLLVKQEVQENDIEFIPEMFDKYSQKIQKETRVLTRIPSISSATQNKALSSIIEEEKEEKMLIEEDKTAVDSLENEEAILEAAEKIQFQRFLEFQRKENLNSLKFASKRPGIEKLVNDEVKNPKLIKSETINEQPKSSRMEEEFSSESNQE